jgi:hypothetical protein
MLKRLDRNDRLEMFADYIGKLRPLDFDMTSPMRCFAAHVEDCFGVHAPSDIGTHKLADLLMINQQQANALYRWRVMDALHPPTPAEGAAKLRSLIKVKV